MSIAQANLLQSEFDFWNQPGLFVYGMVGNLILYRLLWSFAIYVWTKYDINYIAALQFSTLKPNLKLVVNETVTFLLLYCISIIIFCNANTKDSILYDTYLTYGSPFLLLLGCVTYQIYICFFLFGDRKISTGVFNWRVFKRLLSAPFVPVHFRDAFAADFLISFNRMIADIINSTCWIISGSFTTPYTGSVKYVAHI